MKFRAFFGNRALVLLWVGGLIGTLFFFVEIGFAYSLQAFFAVIGLLDRSQINLPEWIPEFTLGGVLWFFIGAAFLRGVIQWLQIYLAGYLQENQKLIQKRRLLHWAFHSPSVSSSHLMTLFNEYTISCGSYLLHLLNVAMFTPTAVLLWFGLLYMIPQTTLIVTGILAVIAGGLRLLDRGISNAGESIGVEEKKINRKVLTNVKNLLLMQISGTQFDEENQVRGLIKKNYRHYVTYVGLNGVKFVIPQFMGVLMICGIALITVQAGGTLPATLVSYFYLFFRLMQAFSEALKNLAGLGFFKPRVETLYNWWQENESRVDRPMSERAASARAKPLDHRVGWSLSDLSFSYPDTNERTLDHLNLSVKPGEAVVITGPSGAGKSTLLSLLLGILHPTEGDIALTDEAGQRLGLGEKKDELLQCVGYVGPDSFLIEGTIQENLTYGLRRKVENREIDRALELAECDFVESLSNGLQYPITDQGQGLSAGQKQRLALARALLRNPKVLILDEATSNLDRETESRLVETLARLKRQVTIVGVTHREALLRIADQKVQLSQ